MTRTGFYASDAQIARMKDAVNAPYIIVGGVAPRSPQEVAHDCALEAGLPEIQGYYGCDLQTKEFVFA
jgi:hypothetical protein